MNKISGAFILVFISKVNVEPLFSFDYTFIEPPNYSTNLLLIVNPKPTPLSLMPSFTFNLPKSLNSLSISFF